MVVVNFDLALTARGDAASGMGAAFGELSARLQGRASALFVVLAGVGIGLLQRSRGERIRRVLARRGVLLIVLGCLLLVVWPADILHYYGTWFLLAAALVGVPPRGLGLLAAVVVLAFWVLAIAGVDYEAHWNFATLEYAGMGTADGLVRHLVFNGFHPTLPWFGFLLTGWALSARLSSAGGGAGRIALIGVLCWAGAELLAGSIGGGELADLLRTDSMPPGPLYMVAAGGAAVALIALLARRERRASPGHREPLVHRVLGAVGRMALTLYVGHVALGILPAYLVTDLTTGPRWSDATAGWVTLGWLATATAVTYNLDRRGHRGPLEVLFRRLGG